MEIFFTAPASLHNRHYEKFADGGVKDIEDEIPFAVPEGWAWCRLKDIVTYIDDGDWIESKEQSDLGIRLLQIGNIGCGHFKDKEGNYHYISEETFKKLNCNEIYPGDILISRLPEPVGRACIVPNLSQRLITAVDCAIIRLKQDIISKNYFIYYTQSAKYLELIKNNCMGTTRLRISRANLEKTLIPLPPLAEQQRIVTAIEAIFTQIDLLEQNKADLQTAVKQAKSKILDLAIRGKLVPQDPADEPASVMLERLRAEKEAKIAAGEIKRGKNDSYIYKNSTDSCYYEKFGGKSDICIDDEIPFELPANWQWCRFGNYIDVRDGTHDSPKYVETGYPFITSKNLINGKIDFSNVQYITEKDHNNYIQRSYVEDDDILFAMIGSIGNPVLIKKDREFSIKNVALFKPYEKKHTDMKFVLFFLSWIQEYLRKIAKGGMQPFIPLNLFRKEIFIPIPPISEQKRIITKIEEIFKALDGIQRNLI